MVIHFTDLATQLCYVTQKLSTVESVKNHELKKLTEWLKSSQKSFSFIREILYLNQVKRPWLTYHFLWKKSARLNNIQN